MQKRSGQAGNLVAVGLQGKMSSVEKMEVDVFDVTTIGFRTCGWEDLIVLAPHDEHGRLVLAEVLLPLWVERWIATIAQEQIELDLIVPFTIQ